MGLILCEPSDIKNPLFVSDLGIRIYTIEELCYVIYNYPLLTTGDFVDDRLIDFLQSDLHMLLPSVKLDKDDIIFAILNASDYYSSQEIEKYKQIITELKKLPTYELLAEKADLLFKLEEYGKAIRIYKQAFNEGIYLKADDIFKFRVCKSLGNCYANLLDLNNAFNAYKDALEIKKDNEVLKRIYFLSKFGNTIGIKKEIMNFLDDRVSPEWDTEYESVVIDAKDSDEIHDLAESLNYDSVKRHRTIAEILNNWKHTYRNMLH